MLPWLRRCRSRDGRVRPIPAADPRPAVLHLFAYTGLATLALAAAGAPRSTHVDASRPTVGWARRNADAVRAGRPRRSAGSSTTRSPSPGARSGADGATPASSSTRRATGTVRARAPGGSRTTCRALLDACAEAARARRLHAADRPHRGVRRRPPGARARPPRLRRPAASIGSGRPGARDARWPDPPARAPSRGRRGGHDDVVRSPTPPVLTSVANPRIKAALALRERRERERTGPDPGRWRPRAAAGARCRGRGRRGVRLRAAAGRPGRPGRARSAARGHGPGPRRRARPSFAKLAFGERAEGLARGRPDPVDRRSTGSTFRADPLVVVIEGVEKPGNIGAVLRSADGAGVDAVVAASPRTDLFNPNAIRASAGTIFTVPLAAAPTAEVLAWLASGGLRIVAARVDAGAALHRGRPDRAARDRPRGGGRRPDRCLGRRRHRGGPPADARRRRQPQRLGQRRDPALRGAPTARPPGPDREGGERGHVRLRHHRCRAGRRGRGLQGARARGDGRGRSTGGGSAAAVRTSAACRRSRCSTEPPGTREPGRATTGRDASARARLHDQPAGRMPPSPTIRVTCDRAARGGRRRLPRAAATIAGRGRVAVRHDDATHELAGDERRRRRRVGLEAAADRGPRRRSRSGPTARRRWPASCRRACSSSAAGRPAASSPRSTSGSASRRRSSSPGRASRRPTIRATPRSCAPRSNATA